MRRYAIRVCGVHTDRRPQTPRTPRERWRLQRRIERIEKRLDQSRGTCINLGWYSWMDRYMAAMEALHGEGCWERIDKGMLIV